jgi:arylsulfatase A-like enzyme
MKVILCLADTFRRDHLGAYGNRCIHTPNLDALAAEGTLFLQHHIGSFPTVPNRRDVFLGRGDKGVPFSRWKPIDPDEVTLPERLAEKHIPSMMVTDTQNTVVANINLWKGFTAWHCNRGQEGDPCWLDYSVPLEFPVPPELIRYTAPWWHQTLMTRAHRQVEEDWFAPGTYKLAMKWLEQNHRIDDFLLYIDTFDPHEPWDPPEWYEKLYDPDFTGRRFDAPTYGIVKELGITKREMRNIHARYCGEVTMVDAAFGRLVAALRKLGLYDETLLIFTSDHGTCMALPGDNGMVCKAHILGDDGRIMSAGRPPKQPLHYYPHYTGVARIPLIVKLPGQRQPVRVQTITQPWDIAPTVLDAFGLAKPPELWGESLIPLARGEQRRIREAAVCGNHVHAQVMTPQWLYATWRGQRPRVLYDLKADPEQKKDVSVKCPEIVKRLRRHLGAYLKRQGMEEQLGEYV